MKNLKMRSKLVLLSVFTGIIPILVISTLIFTTASFELEKSVKKSNFVFSTLTKDQLSSFFNERRGDGNLIADSDSVILPLVALEDKAVSNTIKKKAFTELDEFLNLTLSEYGYTDIFVTDNNGNVVYTVVNKDALDGNDLSVREYVRGGLSGNQTWSKLFYSNFIDKNVMVLSTPVYGHDNSEKPIGTINALFDQDKINDLVHRDVDVLGESGDSYLVDQAGTLLTETRLGNYTKDAALNASIETSAVKELSEAIKRGESTFAKTYCYKDYLGHKVYGSLKVVKFGDDHAGLIIEVDAAEAFAGVIALRTVTVVMVLMVIILSLACLYFMSKSISKPLFAVAESAEIIANYDLSGNIEDRFLERKDEIGTIANSIQDITVNLRSLLTDIGNTSEQVATSSHLLSTTSQQSATASREISLAVNEIAKGASSQAESTTHGTEKLDVLGSTIEQGKSNIHSLIEATSSVSETINDGLSLVKDLEQKTKANGEAATIVYDSIVKTNDSSSKIGEASGLIASIAEQTNLLALNAAIEAARAGEHGKGFAVVADEIRQLAEQSTNSTKNIDDMVTRLVEDAETAVQKMEEAISLTKEQEQSVSLTRTKFNEISDAMQSAESIASMIESASQVMDEQKNQVQDVIQSLSAIAEENAAATEETSAAIDEQTSCIQEISSSSEDLERLAVELRELNDKFKL